MKTSFIYIATLFIILINFASCKKFVDIPPSPVLITDEAVFKDSTTLLSAVNGVYIAMRTASPSFANGSITIYTGLTADELSNTGGNSSYAPFSTNVIPATNTAIQGMFWSAPYNIIYRTNTILEGLGRATQIPALLKKQLSGEMLTVRALMYFYLTSLYGDVPLVITTDYRQSALTGRTSSAEVFRQMISDLKSAEVLLKDSYPSDGKVRPNKYTATAMLARIYLFQKDWTNAAVAALDVTSSGQYNLANIRAVFLKNSPETIWEIASPGEARNSAEAASFIPASATTRPALSVSAFLLNAFEANDQRKTAWLKSNTISGTAYYYPYKYKNRASTPVTEYNIVLRLAEQYLILAEALARQSVANVPQAVAALNQVRTRAGLPALSESLSQNECLDAVMRERRIELFAEWGHRWFDLKRTGTIDNVLSAEKTDWLQYKSLFPIPYNQTLFNVQLKQNPGYN